MTTSQLLDSEIARISHIARLAHGKRDLQHLVSRYAEDSQYKYGVSAAVIKSRLAASLVVLL